MQCMQKQTSICFFLCGLHLRHFHPFIRCHLEAGFFAGYIHCVAMQYIYMYRCRFHSPTKSLTRIVLLKELYRHFLQCCMMCPHSGICTEGLRLHLGLVFFRIFYVRLAVCVKDNINPTTLCTYIQYHGQYILCKLCTCFVVAVHPLYQTHPINDVG